MTTPTIDATLVIPHLTQEVADLTLRLAVALARAERAEAQILSLIEQAEVTEV